MQRNKLPGGEEILSHDASEVEDVINQVPEELRDVIRDLYALGAKHKLAALSVTLVKDKQYTFLVAGHESSLMWKFAEINRDLMEPIRDMVHAHYTEPSLNLLAAMKDIFGTDDVEKLRKLFGYANMNSNSDVIKN